MVFADKYGRPLRALRLIVTQRCNLSCFFCHREGDVHHGGEELPAYAYDIIAKGARLVGVEELKITGGEPLLRGDIIEIVATVRRHVGKVSLTTNGSLLNRLAPDLADAGLDHVNVSIPSLDEAFFREMTGGTLRPVLEGLRAALESRLKVKINFVALKQNVSEMHRLISFASDLGVDINVIQLMPVFFFERNPLKALDLYSRFTVDVARVEEALRKSAVRIEVKQPHNRVVYVMPTGIRVIVIKGYGNPFACITCDRMRVTHDGLLMTCLYKDEPTYELKDCIAMGSEKCVAHRMVTALRAREPSFKLPVQLSALVSKMDGRGA